MVNAKEKLYENAVPLVVPDHIDELKRKGLKFNEHEVVMTVKDPQ